MKRKTQAIEQTGWRKCARVSLGDVINWYKSNRPTSDAPIKPLPLYPVQSPLPPLCPSHPSTSSSPCSVSFLFIDVRLAWAENILVIMRDGNCLGCVGCVQHPFLVGRDEWWFYCVRVMDCLMGSMDLPLGLTTPFFLDLFLLITYAVYGKFCCLNMSLTMPPVTFILFLLLFRRADRLREHD